jgi:xanthine dehydrogenase molybdenum-binding subunit
MTEYSYLGKSLRRDRDQGKLTGKSIYAADIRLPGMLWGKILHSPYAHARILSIDSSETQRIPGVKAVVTNADTPGVKIGRWLQDRHVLAQDEVRYIGEPVVAVAAIDQETAEEALEAIRVEYEELPAVFDPLLAMQPDAPLVHADLDAIYPKTYRHRGRGNIILEAVVRQGDIEKGLSESDVIHRDSYRTQAVHQGFMEPHAVVADLDSQGKATLWSSTKAPFIVRRMTAKALQIPMSRLRVIAPTIGGDFGGKGTAYIEPIALLLARKAGFPVKLALSREEELTSTFVRDAAIIELTLGATKEGRLLALKGQAVFDSGAYCDLGGGLESALTRLIGPYNIPHLELKGYRVYTNKIPRGNVRAPSGPHPTFAIESHLDGLAKKLGLDPIAIRLDNGVQEGDVLPEGGAILKSIGFKPTLMAVADYLKRERGLREKNRGWGIACGQWGVSPVKGREGPTSSAWVKINEDGTVVLLTGATENGGGQHGIFAQIVGEILRVPPDSVTVIASDTDCTPFEQGTGGSRTTYRAGTSVRIAAEDALQKLLDLAAEKLGASPDDIGYTGGQVFVKSSPEKTLTLAALAFASLTSRRGPIIGVGEKLREEMLAVQVTAENEVDFGTYGTHAVQVEVDPETGLVKVLKYFAAHDVGFALHPQNVRGQIEGGVAFGMGYALSEELVIEQGRVQNPHFVDYKLPTIMNVPPIESAIVEVPSRFGPFGAKGVGEPPCIPVAPAIANAVYDAVGVRINDIPATPEKIFLLLHQSGK